MPTGVALPEPRQQLFDAADRVLVRSGVVALTSRAVTSEAGVAKGVLHRHFTDFDDFLVELVLDRLGRLRTAEVRLCDAAGTGTVGDNVTAGLFELFHPVAVAIVGLVIARDTLRDRLRRVGAGGLPLLEEGAAMVARYLDAERRLGRIAADADIPAIAPTLIGAAHLQFADRTSPPPTSDDIRRIVRSVVAAVLAGDRS